MTTPKKSALFLCHPIAPVWNERSTLLILGSFPSVKSRETGFYYGHRQNRFWPLLSRLYQEDMPTDIPGKKAFLLRNGIALWDVVASCRILGSSDSSIADVTVNDIRPLLEKSAVRRIFCNGGTAFSLYRKYLLPLTGQEGISLPSTSPANARMDEEALFSAWAVIRQAPVG